MRRVTPQPSFGHDLSASLLDRFREYSVALNQCADHRLSEFVSVTGTYTAGQNDHVIECAPSGAMTVTLPAASVMRNKRIVIKRTNNTTHTVTIQSSSGNIDGAASVTLTTAHQSREVFSDGANWWLLDAGATAPTDPYWANVVLMLHGDGANDGATITDSSSYARSSTAYRSGSKTVTTEKKFGTASITAAASTGSHQFSDSTDFALSGAFTFEFWIKTVVQANEGYLFAGYEAGSGGRYWIVNAAGTTLNFVLWPVTISLITLTQGQWTHIAISRDGSGYFRIFKDGVELYGATHAASYTGAIEFSVTNLALEQWTTQASFAGYIDDVRFTQGVARYTSAFDVPTEAFPNQ